MQSYAVILNSNPTLATLPQSDGYYRGTWRIRYLNPDGVTPNMAARVPAPFSLEESRLDIRFLLFIEYLGGIYPFAGDSAVTWWIKTQYLREFDYGTGQGLTILHDMPYEQRSNAVNGVWSNVIETWLPRRTALPPYKYRNLTDSLGTMELVMQATGMASMPWLVGPQRFLLAPSQGQLWFGDIPANIEGPFWYGNTYYSGDRVHYMSAQTGVNRPVAIASHRAKLSAQVRMRCAVSAGATKQAKLTQFQYLQAALVATTADETDLNNDIRRMRAHVQATASAEAVTFTLEPVDVDMHATPVASATAAPNLKVEFVVLFPLSELPQLSEADALQKPADYRKIAFAFCELFLSQYESKPEHLRASTATITRSFERSGFRYAYRDFQLQFELVLLGERLLSESEDGYQEPYLYGSLEFVNSATHIGVILSTIPYVTKADATGETMDYRRLWHGIFEALFQKYNRSQAKPQMFTALKSASVSENILRGFQFQFTMDDTASNLLDEPA